MKYRELQEGEVIPRNAEVLRMFPTCEKFAEGALNDQQTVLLMVLHGLDLTPEAVRAITKTESLELFAKTEEESGEAYDRKIDKWMPADQHYGYKVGVGDRAISYLGRPFIFRVPVEDTKAEAGRSEASGGTRE